MLFRVSQQHLCYQKTDFQVSYIHIVKKKHFIIEMRCLSRMCVQFGLFYATISVLFLQNLFIYLTVKTDTTVQHDFHGLEQRIIHLNVDK